MRVAASGLVAASVLAGTAAAQTAPLTPPDIPMMSPTGVSMTDTTLTYTTTDLAMGPLKLERSYYGGAERSRHYFGYGWTHNFDMWAFSMTIGILGPNPRPMTRVVIGRKTYMFDTQASATPFMDGLPSGGSDGTRVELENGLIMFTDRDGTKYRFNSATDGRVNSVTYPNGVVLTFSYNGSSRLKMVSSNQGYALIFDLDGAGNVTAACGFNRAVTYVTTSTTCASATIKTSYGYTSGNLTSATSVMGDVANYTYYSGSQLKCLTEPGEAACKYTMEYMNGQPSQVTKQTLADGTFWSFSCTCVYAHGLAEGPSQVDGTSWTDPSGASVGFDLNDGVITEYFDQVGKRRFVYFYSGQLSGMSQPEGNRWYANITNRGIFSGDVFTGGKTGVSGYPNITQNAKTFPTGDCANRITCNLPLTITDGNNNVATFTYDQTHGGVLTETRPANNAGVQAVVRHAYVQRTAWVKNSSGTYSAEPAIWLPSEDRACKTGATNVAGNSCANGSSEEVITTYEYGPDSGPNTLLPRGKAVTAGGTTLRVCYGYDAQGNKISETNARAGLASCP
ncbi:hypothetical protein [Caulobacter segnis]|uniref:hypothetical protein n=1 Tax=Caulobacter segnis TaxID=88688 RepID=UPI00286498B8|nr:hypothetical protein [Caulobacter segnis]MDR6624347.1 YD repeat-containing protein [Caulobacter segnis]